MGNLNKKKHAAYGYSSSILLLTHYSFITAAYNIAINYFFEKHYY